MNKNNTNQNEIPKPDSADGKVFADAILNAEGKLLSVLTAHFTDEMNKAIEGRITTPKRMAKLYPIFREINFEMEEIIYWQNVEQEAEAEAEVSK